MTRPHYMASIDACAAHYGDDADAMRNFLIAGHEKALQWITAALSLSIQAAHWSADFAGLQRVWFLCVHRVLQPEELKDIEEDLEAMKQRFPVGPGEPLAADGSPDSDLIALH